jgi:hypothetical protein
MGHLTLIFDASIFLPDAGERKAELSERSEEEVWQDRPRGQAGAMTLKKHLSILLIVQLLGVVGL